MVECTCPDGFPDWDAGERHDGRCSLSALEGRQN